MRHTETGAMYLNQEYIVQQGIPYVYITREQGTVFRNNTVILGIVDGGGPTPLDIITPSERTDYPSIVAALEPAHAVVAGRMSGLIFTIHNGFSAEQELSKRPEYYRKNLLEEIQRHTYEPGRTMMVSIHVNSLEGLASHELRRKKYELLHLKLIEFAAKFRANILFQLDTNTILLPDQIHQFPKQYGSVTQEEIRVPRGSKGDLIVIGYRQQHVTV